MSNAEMLETNLVVCSPWLLRMGNMAGMMMGNMPLTQNPEGPGKRKTDSRTPQKTGETWSLKRRLRGEVLPSCAV